MTKHIDNMTDEEVIKLRKDLSDRNWQAVGEFINSMAAEISELKREAQERDKQIGSLTQAVQGLTRQVGTLTVMNRGSGPTGGN